MGKLRKHEHKTIAANATKLVAKWKKTVAATAAASSTSSPAQGSKLRASGGAAGGSRENGHDTGCTVVATTEASEENIVTEKKGNEHDVQDVVRRGNGDEERKRDKGIASPGSPSPGNVGSPPSGNANRVSPAAFKRPPVLLPEPPRQRVFEMLTEALTPTINQALPRMIPNLFVLRRWMNSSPPQDGMLRECTHLCALWCGA